MDLDQQAIERRDFPIGRRGYDPAAVDAHLRALAVEFEELRRAPLNGGPELSLAVTASSQVQSILEAAETTAAEIERQASERAREVRESADRDADRTREEAIQKSRSHVTAVAQVTESLLERVGSMDGEVGALSESVRAGAGRLAADLAAVQSGMIELYDAAAGRGVTDRESPAMPGAGAERSPSVLPAPAQAAPIPQPAVPAERQPPTPAVPSAPVAPAVPPPDLDGARLVALNMALNGEPRAQTDRYLAENYQLPDRAKLVDEVYAAIEG